MARNGIRDRTAYVVCDHERVRVCLAVINIKEEIADRVLKSNGDRLRKRAGSAYGTTTRRVDASLVSRKADLSRENPSAVDCHRSSRGSRNRQRLRNGEIENRRSGVAFEGNDVRRHARGSSKRREDQVHSL